MKPIILALLLIFSGVAGSVLAQAGRSPGAISAPKPDPRLVQLEMALNHLTQEQQAVYQQFQMIQELRRSEIQDINPIIMGPPAMGGVKEGPPPSYDDTVRLQQERRERIEQYDRDLNQLYLRYAELGNQKKILLDQMTELAREVRETAR
jgi:hypothetical protein